MRPPGVVFHASILVQWVRPAPLPAVLFSQGVLPPANDCISGAVHYYGA